MEKNLNQQEIIDNNANKLPEHYKIKYVPVQNCYAEKIIIEPKLIGTVTRKELIEREIIFDAPKKDVVLKVINIMKEIEIKDVKVTGGNILVTGYLNNCIMYTTMKRPQMENSGGNNNQGKNNENGNNTDKHGYVNTKNDKNSENNKNKNKENEKAKPSCGVVDNSIALDGVLRHTTIWTPFKAFIPAPEAQEEDICTVTSSAVLNELGAASITEIYEEEYDVEGENENISITRAEEVQKFIKGIIDKTLIEFTVDVKRYPKEQ